MPATRVQFGPYELNLKTGELRKNGLSIRLQRRSFQILTALLERPGEVVTREDLRARIWSADTFVDFESGLNTAANRLRLALSDSAEQARYVETVARIGYRFAGMIVVEAEQPPLESATATAAEVVAEIPRTSMGGRESAARGWLPWTIAILAALAAVAAIAVVILRRTEQPVFHQLSFRRGIVRNAVFVPGNSDVVLSANWDTGSQEIYETSALGPEIRALKQQGVLQGVSPAGEIAILSFGVPGAERLSAVPINGGAPRDIAVGVLGASWISKSELALFRRDGPGMAIEFPMGHTVFRTGGAISSIRASPDGSRIAFLDHPVAGDTAGTLRIVGRGGDARSISTGWAAIGGIAWGASGREVWFTASREGVPHDLFAATLNGTVRKIATLPGEVELMDISSGGRVLLAIHQSREVIEEYDARHDSRGNLKRVADRGSHHDSYDDQRARFARDLSWFDWSNVQEISADGRSMLFDESGEGGGEGGSVFVRDLATGDTTRVGRGRALDLDRDGSQILAIDPRHPDHLTIWPKGAGLVKTIGGAGLTYHWGRFLPGQKKLVVGADREGDNSTVWIQDVGTGAVSSVGSGCCVPPVAVSPDGNRIAGPNPQRKVVVMSLHSGDVRELNIRAIPVRWVTNQNLFVAQRGMELRVISVDVNADRYHVWTTLSPSEPFTVFGFQAIAMPAEPGLFAYSYVRRLSDLYAVDGWK